MSNQIVLPRILQIGAVHNTYATRVHYIEVQIGFLEPSWHLQTIPRYSSCCLNNGNALAHKAVKQGRLAYIGSSDNGNERTG